MRSFAKFIVLICLLAVVSSCSDDNHPWAKYTSAEGGFTVMMPSRVKKSEKKEYTVFGKQITHFVTWKPSSFAIDKFKLFQVSYTDCPPRIAADSALLNSALDSAMAIRKKDFTEGDLEAENVDLNGDPGRSFLFVNKDEDVAIVRECIVNNRKYDLTVVTKKNYKTSAEVGTFFNSFQSLR